MVGSAIDKLAMRLWKPTSTQLSQNWHYAKGASLSPVYCVRQDPQVDVERLKKSLACSYSYQLNKSVLVGAAGMIFELFAAAMALAFPRPRREPPLILQPA